MSAPRVRRPLLPEETNGPHFRQALTEILNEIVEQINYTAHDWTVITTATATPRVLASDLNFIIPTEAGLNVNLPQAKHWRDRTMSIKIISTGQILLVPYPDQEIDSSSLTYTLSGIYSSMQLMSDGNNWWIVSKDP